jgi:hypothetical protein
MLGITEAYCIFCYAESYVSKHLCMDRDSIVGIVTTCGLDGLGIKSWWRRNFLHA